MKRNVFVSVLVLLLWVSSSFAFAQKPSVKTMEKGKRMMENRLSLSKEQKSKLRSIRNKYSIKLEELQFDIRKKRMELADEFRRENPDKKKIEKKLDEIISLERKRHSIIISEFFEVRKILNPEQRRIYSLMMARVIMKMR